MKSFRAFRVLGSVSVDLVQVAAGRADGIVLLPADPWDFAVSALILKESGAGVVYFEMDETSPGSVKTFHEPPSYERRCGLMATAPGIFEEAVAQLP